RRGRRGGRDDRLRAHVRAGAPGTGPSRRPGPGRGPRLMARAKVQYACTACGGVSGKWQGQCPHCAEWDNLEESIAGPRGAAGRFQSLAAAEAVVAIAEVTAEAVGRMSTGSEEFDRVLGGGLVDGSVVLIGGDPGIGKSTLLLQALVHMARE